MPDHQREVAVAGHPLSREQAWNYRIIPGPSSEKSLLFYYDSNSIEHDLRDELEVIFGSKVRLESLDALEIDQLLSKHYFADDTSILRKENQILSTNEDFLSKLIDEALRLKSSDIHIESYEKKCRVRIRIDGVMVERYTIPESDYPALVNKIKIMGSLDIAEKRLPQDGRIHYKPANQSSFDIRVSVLPTLHREKVVLRLLKNSSVNVDIHSMGMSSEDLNNYMAGVHRPNGIILISGPTGSGKTTTLYATLKLLNKSTRNILTIEDPIEYTLEGVNQVQLKESIGLGFAAALRTFLRQDPDVIMVGEIRDPETANMAIRAALTGHLVLSTIHTNSAWGTVARLIDMGIPPFLVASTLNTSVAQRLVRILCPRCKVEKSFTPGDCPSHLKLPALIKYHFVPKGCAECYYTGNKGREAVYEVIPVDVELASAIKSGNLNVTERLASKSIHTISENAITLFKSGKTSLEEIVPLLSSI